MLSTIFAGYDPTQTAAALRGVIVTARPARVQGLFAAAIFTDFHACARDDVQATTEAYG
jgi:hypothetical protein